MPRVHASRNPRSAFRLRRLAESGWPRRVLLTTAPRILVHGGHCSWQAQGKPRALVLLSSTFRDRWKGSELFYFELVAGAALWTWW